MRSSHRGPPAAVAVLLAGTALAGTTQSHTVETEMKNLTPIIVVEAIEPCLPFWTERLGFEVIATVPHDGVTGFAMLKNGGVDVMYQSRASVDADLGASGGPADLGAQLEAGKSTLFIEVDAIDPLLDKLAGVDVVVPRRTTFYGMDEVFVQAPCGTLVGFAAKVGQG